MKLTKHHLIEGQIIKKGTEIRIVEDISNNIEEFVDWFTTLEIPARNKGLDKVDFSVLKDLKSLVAEYQSASKQSIPAIWDMQKEEFTFKILGRFKNIRTSKEDIEQAFSKTAKSLPDTIEKKYATYYKRSSISYKAFLDQIDNLEQFFSELKKPHSKALDKLQIHFVDSSELNSIANYSTQYDLVRINPKKAGNTLEEYGSMRYVLLHELGHRYIDKNPQSWNYDSYEWVTTKYSIIDSMSGEEKFAELFALSHWKEKYREYEDTINKFLKIIK